MEPLQDGFEALGRVVMSSSEFRVDDGMLMATGVITYLRFFVTVPGLLTLYAIAEGTVRLLGAGLTGEPSTIAPLWLAAEAGAAIERRRQRERLALLIPDVLVYLDDGALIIATCRPRDWDDCTTVAVDANLFGVEEYRIVADDPQRPHRYRLREWPATTAVRRLVAWSPELVLQG